MTDKDRDLVEELLTRAHPSNVDITDRAAARIQTLSAENERLREHIARQANTINIVGSPYHKAQEALDEIVLLLKREARAALEG